jgi:predicted RNase H-like HicB family nuclease
MKLYMYPITVEREGRRYWAYSEDFPGVYGLGNSIEEAKASILESMRLYRGGVQGNTPAHTTGPDGLLKTVSLIVWG